MALPFIGMMKKRESIHSITMALPFNKRLRLFLTPFLVLVDASRNDEARDAVIGLDIRWNLLYVVHIEQEAKGIRIISARKATHQERINYEN